MSTTLQPQSPTFGMHTTQALHQHISLVVGSAALGVGSLPYNFAPRSSEFCVWRGTRREEEGSQAGWRRVRNLLVRVHRAIWEQDWVCPTPSTLPEPN